MLEPKRVLVTRAGDPDHARLEREPAMLMWPPKVGESLQMFLDTGQTMQTSRVKAVESHDDEVMIETMNSRYHVKLAS